MRKVARARAFVTAADGLTLREKEYRTNTYETRADANARPPRRDGVSPTPKTSLGAELRQEQKEEEERNERVGVTEATRRKERRCLILYERCHNPARPTFFNGK